MAALEAQLHTYAANVYLIARNRRLSVRGAARDHDCRVPQRLPALAGAADSIPLVILQLLAPYTPAPFGSLVAGSASNLSFVLFFAASLATLRRPIPRVCLTPAPDRAINSAC
jgi:hypothetical protein